MNRNDGQEDRDLTGLFQWPSSCTNKDFCLRFRVFVLVKSFTLHARSSIAKSVELVSFGQTVTWRIKWPVTSRTGRCRGINLSLRSMNGLQSQLLCDSFHRGTELVQPFWEGNPVPAATTLPSMQSLWSPQTKKLPKQSEASFCQYCLYVEF